LHFIASRVLIATYLYIVVGRATTNYIVAISFFLPHLNQLQKNLLPHLCFMVVGVYAMKSFCGSRIFNTTHIVSLQVEFIPHNCFVAARYNTTCIVSSQMEFMPHN
jgi:H+/gluconate symporter-like permease